jgi:hypothetical protein
MKTKVLFLIFFLSFGDNVFSQKDPLISSIEKLSYLSGDYNLEGVLSEVKNNRKVGFVFLNDECPICQYYASDLDSMYMVSLRDSIMLIGIFSGNYKRIKLLKFSELYELKLPIFIDPDFSIARQLQAKITPEVILVDVDDVENSILYSGLIDDRFASLGIRRSKIKHRYFFDALSALRKNHSNYIKKTDAIGCAIATNK